MSNKLIIDDARENLKSINWPETARFVVAVDTALSGWGMAPGRSFYALAIEVDGDEAVLLANMAARSDMDKPRVVTGYRNLIARGTAGDHIKIVDRGEASRWYEPGGFAPPEQRPADVSMRRIVRGEE